METKEYCKIMCKNCVNYLECTKDLFKKTNDNNITVFKCNCYKKNTQSKKTFVYKNQLFEYEVLR